MIFELKKELDIEADSIGIENVSDRNVMNESINFFVS